MHNYSRSPTGTRQIRAGILGYTGYSGSELAGVTFSPDGSTLFVNIQVLGKTVAITGPWRKA